MNSRPRIAIVEDDSDLRHSTEEFLAATGYEVWSADCAEAFYRRQVADPVDVVVLDLGLPGEDGLGVVRLLQQNPRIAVIILSGRATVEDRLAGLHAGADRYLVKPVEPLELAANIDAVAKRLNLASQRALFEWPRPLREPQGTEPSSARHWRLCSQDWFLVAPDANRLDLTAREFALLHRLIAEQGQAVPKRSLADELFGVFTANSAERLNVLVARLRKKAAAVFGQELPIKTAHQIGYAFTAPARLVQCHDEL